MEYVIRMVKEIAPAERGIYERLLERPLQDNQCVVVMVLDPGDDRDEANEAMDKIAKSLANPAQSDVDP